VQDKRPGFRVRFVSPEKKGKRSGGVPQKMSSLFACAKKSGREHTFQRKGKGSVEKKILSVQSWLQTPHLKSRGLPCREKRVGGAGLGSMGWEGQHQTQLLLQVLACGNVTALSKACGGAQEILTEEGEITSFYIWQTYLTESMDRRKEGLQRCLNQGGKSKEKPIE